MYNPFAAFLASVAQMIANEKRALLEAEIARKKANMERIRANKCNWDDFYAKNKALHRLDMNFDA